MGSGKWRRPSAASTPTVPAAKHSRSAAALPLALALVALASPLLLLVAGGRAPVGWAAPRLGQGADSARATGSGAGHCARTQAATLGPCCGGGGMGFVPVRSWRRRSRGLGQKQYNNSGSSSGGFGGRWRGDRHRHERRHGARHPGSHGRRHRGGGGVRPLVGRPVLRSNLGGG